jgi:hypothetical protein
LCDTTLIMQASHVTNCHILQFHAYPIDLRNAYLSLSTLLDSLAPQISKYHSIFVSKILNSSRNSGATTMTKTFFLTM